jgi:hypothetical protein
MLDFTAKMHRWANSQDDEPTFIANLRDELSKAHDPAAPIYQTIHLSKMRLSQRLDAERNPPARQRGDLPR